MTMKLIRAIQSLQEHLLESGLARAVLSVSAPRMLSLPSPSAVGAEPANLFVAMITEPEIDEVSRDLFVSGFYSQAVQESFKVLEKTAKVKKSGIDQPTTTLMEMLFNHKDPILCWTDRLTQSEQDEQKGYQRLFSGAILGIRNPVTHEINWIDDPRTALELISFAQHLLRKLKAAKPPNNKS